MISWQKTILCELSAAECEIYVYRAFKQVNINHLLSISLLPHLISYCFGGVFAKRLKNNFFKYFKTLITQLGCRVHLNIKPIKVLEKGPHPFDHYLMVSPSLVQLREQCCSLKLLQIFPNICF
jgi:hypothetical protein